MTPDIILSWNQQKIKLKHKYASLKDADLIFEPGKKDEMFFKLQIKLGKSQEELHAIILAL